MSLDDLREAARLYTAAAEELEAAARHSRVAARHYLDAEALRGAAHAFAACGHVSRARRDLDRGAELHASKAVAE